MADSFSRVDSVYLAFDNNLANLAKAQEDDEELKAILQNKETSLNLKSIRWGTDHTTIVCDFSGDVLRSFVPRSIRKQIFDIMHNPAHPSAKISD